MVIKRSRFFRAALPWLKRSLLALLTAFFIIWSFNLRTSILAPVHATDNQIVQRPANAQELVEQSRKLYGGGEFGEAVTILQQAEAAFRKQGDILGQAIALGNLSLAFQQLGQLEKALELIAASLNLLENNENVGGAKERSQVLAQTLDIQANLQLELGKPQQALDTWQQAANIYAGMGNEIGKTRTLINLAQAQQALGLHRQARKTLEQLSASLEGQPDSVIKATALRSLGDVLQLVGDLEKSLKVLQESRDIAQRLKSPQELAATFLSLGNTQRALGNRARSLQHPASFEKPTPLSSINIVRAEPNRPKGEALKFYQQAAQFYAEAATISASSLGQIQAQLNRLSVLLELHKWSEAQKLSSELQIQLNKIPPSQTAIYAQINLAQSLVRLKQATTADVPSWREIAQGLATAIQQAKSIADKRSEAYALGAFGGLYLEAEDLPNAEELTKQALILAQQIKAADIAYLWQWQLGYLLKIQGNTTGAIASYTQAVNTLKSLRSDLVALNPDVQFSFRDNVEPVYRQFVDLLLQRGQNQKEVSQKNLKQARNAIESLQLSELENFFQEACLQAQARQIDEIVDKTDPTAAVIYPIILPDRLEVILKLPTSSELRHYTIYQSQSEVDSTLEKLQQYLKEPDRINDVKKLSQQVYSWLIQPLEAELGKMEIKTLVFVLDGYLRNIPMAVLYDNKQKQYLVQKYAIALTPGLQLIDPKPLQREKLNALIAGVTERREIEGYEFAPLENVELELKTIQAQISKSKELLNQSFTKTNLQHQVDSDPFSVVHIATHGEFSSNAEKTFILAWEELLKVRDFDNLLRLRDTSESRPIELLVLSACETALGDKRAALGLAGIAVRAGARSTLATLWSVEDKSTAELMSQFYQELKKTTVTKAEALRNAQLALLTKDENPYYWGAYVLVGNWL